MKRALLVVCGLALSSPSFAHGGGGGHFAPHDYVTPPLSQRVGSFFRPHDYVTPPLARRTEPTDYVTPPLGRRIGQNDYVTPPLGRTTGQNDYVTPPLAQRVQDDAVSTRLVKPAWQE